MDKSISVLIPTFNSSRTIALTIQSVLEQTIAPNEIVVLDDGSTDDTVSILRSYGSLIRVVQQENSGCATARNRLFALASGEMVAFLDSDDIWHPRYLEVQGEAFERNPKVGLFFTGHFDFRGYDPYCWEHESRDDFPPSELITPADFIGRYYDKTGLFGSMSFCCVRRDAVRQCGDEPFKVDGADDSHLFTLIALLGWPVIYNAEPLVAYRIIGEGFSADRVRVFGRSVKVLEILSEKSEGVSNSSLAWEFGRAFALQRRSYAKVLMGVARVSEARKQIASSLTVTRDAKSMAKSVALLVQTYLPKPLQPTWPAAFRQ